MAPTRTWLTFILMTNLCGCSSGKGAPEARVPRTQAEPNRGEHDAAQASEPETDGAQATNAGEGSAATDGDSAQASDAANTNIATGKTACPKTRSATRVGALDPDQLTEASGMVASRKNKDLLWTHNDSGDSARLLAIKADGSVFAEVSVAGAAAYDWEDIAIGPGPSSGETYLFVGDVGDNEKKRQSVQIYRVPEPTLDASGKPAQTATAFVIDVRYEDEAHDCETVLVDPMGGDLYLVAKGGLFEINKEMPIYRVTADDMKDGQATARKVASARTGPSTAGDVLPDGSGVAVRNYTGIMYWPRDPKRPLFEAFSERSCALPLGEPFGTQGEAFAFAADGSGYFTTSEGKDAPVLFYAFED